MTPPSTPLELKVENLHWISEDAAKADLCAHGHVTVRIGRQVLSTPEDGDWCVSAAALYLLRTVTQDYVAGNANIEQLIPCCGHAMYPPEDGDDVVIVGCPNGVSWNVRHSGASVVLSTSDESVTVPLNAWREAVCEFAHTVECFYQQSDAKRPNDDFEAQGYAAFWAEWKRRQAEAECR